MKNFLIVTLFAVVASFASGAPSSSSVEIPGLGRIRGFTQSSATRRRNIHSFTGIPYGSIPSRFSPADLVTSFDQGEFDATKPQLACMQPPLLPILPGPFVEDCLTLNVHTPKITGNKKLPVIFYIHGGSFIRWSGNMFQPQRLLDKDVVVVTINYRLNVFGFFCLGTNESPGNIGLYDQLLALKWVNRYIEYFGGDKDLVTIAGQSAGAVAVTYLMDSPLAKGYFHRAIASSGDDLAGWGIQNNPIGNSLAGAAVVGCYNPNSTNVDVSAILNCMRNIPASALLNANSAFYSAPSVQTFNLTIPKMTPVSPYTSIATTGLQSTVPMILGTTKNEGSFLLSRTYTSLAPTGLLGTPDFLKTQLPTALLTSTGFGVSSSPLGIIDTLINTYLGDSKSSGSFSKMTPGLIDIYSVFYFKSLAWAKAKAHSTVGDTYLYSFDYYGSQTLYPYLGGVPEIPRGVTHTDDQMYLFYFGEFTKAEDKLISGYMVDFWTNFATTGNPNSVLSLWPKFTVDGARFLKINTIPTTGNDYTDYWVDATKKV